MSGERLKDPDFLEWAKRQGGDCCVCRATQGISKRCDELHHYDWKNRGMGIKGRDHWTCRLCYFHHRELQGKGRMWFLMNDRQEIYTAMLEDSLNLLSDYVLEKNGGVF